MLILIVLTEIGELRRRDIKISTFYLNCFRSNLDFVISFLKESDLEVRDKVFRGTDLLSSTDFLEVAF